MASPTVRLKVVKFKLWIDVEKYTDPSTWNFNEIFGFQSISKTDACITHPTVEDGGTLTAYLAERKRCQPQKI